MFLNTKTLASSRGERTRVVTSLLIALRLLGAVAVTGVPHPVRLGVLHTTSRVLLATIKSMEVL
jgi:hypothetical protein